ncbi:hypothetical protein HPB52_005104 [Rhipicephalus sanguineus]|uniref:Peptidase M14 domain-containing protein n=1 Tax=Rhipicephalus sanguineus TaxID=34632 RepID=A0A9D4QGL0_RHISA|nr:hypothetical protein HPB52_005104 [Rhipicephalus sanguineus]
MTTGYGSDSTITTLLQTFDFYIFPVVNPDGYAYTFTSDRLWRKNRSGGRRGCRGVDPNRNFAAAFGGSAAGSSSDWVYDGAKIKYSLAVELRDKGRYGFLLPNFLIVPTADEASEGFKAFAKFVARRELNKFIH